MAYAPQTLLAAAKTAADSVAFRIEPADLMATVVGYGFAAGDLVDLQISHDGGTTFANYYKDGTQQQLSATNTAVSVNSVGYFRVHRNVTTNDVGVVLELPSRIMAGG